MPTINDGRLSGGKFEAANIEKEARRRQILTSMTEEDLRRQVSKEELASLAEVQAYKAALETMGNPSLGDPDDEVDTEHVGANMRRLVAENPNLPLIVEILTGKRETEGTEE